MAADDNATPSRRGLLKIAATAAALAPVGAAASQAQDAGADAELLALCADWRRAFDREAVVLDRLGYKHDTDWSDEDRALIAEVQGDVYDLEDRVFATKATTLAGIKAKAGVLEYLDTAAGIPAEREYAASLVADIMALGGAA